MKWPTAKSKHSDRRIGVDIGTDGIAVAGLRRRPGEAPELLACDFQAVGAGGDRGAALKAMIRAHDLHQGECNLVLESGRYALPLVESPDVPADELRAAVRWKIRDLIDFHIDDAVIDVFEIPNDKAGRQQMMYAVAAPIQLVRDQIELARQVDLDLKSVDIAELAQRNIAAQLPQDLAGLALLYLGPTSGLITLTRKATLYMARHLNMGIETLGPLPKDEHDELGPPPQAIGWLDVLVVEIQRSLDYFESNFSQAPIKELAIAPMPRRIPGICRYLSAQLGVNTRMLDLSAVIDAADAIDPILQARCFPAVGAALREEHQPL